MIDKDLGYIRLTQFQENSYREMTEAVKALTNSGAKGLVLDLRNNGGGLLNEAISIASIFLPVNQTVVFTRERDKQEKHYKTESVNFSNRTIPMVIIVNEWSASASEIIAGSMQDYKRAVIVGKSTFGKGSVQSIVPLPDGSAVRLTTSRYYTPAARSIQGVGIKPDVEVEPGIIEYNSDYYVIKEKDLSGHLKGENEKDNSSAVDDAIKRASQVLPLNDDLQYISAVQVLKGANNIVSMTADSCICNFEYQAGENTVKATADVAVTTASYNGEDNKLTLTLNIKNVKIDGKQVEDYTATTVTLPATEKQQDNQ